MKKYVILLLAVLPLQELNAQIAVNTDHSSADASAMLDVKSSSKGMLAPRMTSAQRAAVSSPATGLFVYQTDAVTGFYYYDGATWQPVTPPAPAPTPVIYSGWQYAANFRDTSIDGSAVQVASLPAASLTASMLATASIQIYLTFGGGIFTLPYTSYAGGKTNTIYFIPQAGSILIVRFTHDDSNAVALSTLLQYSFVIIPGNTSVSNFKGNSIQPVQSNASSVPVKN